MKKAFLFVGMAAASLLFVGCNKEADFAGNGAMPFKVVLGFEETKTVTTDGIHVDWADGDKINVFHAEAGTTDYLHDTPYSDNTGHPFTVSDTDNGVFTGTLMGGDLETGKSYDWYFYYPYNSYLKSPVNTKDARLYIGGRSDQPQTQEGYDSRLHLAGGSATACFPLYGIVKNVSAETQPSVTMKHIASAIQVNVTNGTSAGITIDEIEFVAPEAIVGNFYISFDKEPLTITPYESQSSASASLKVNNPTVLAAGATAAFYMGIKPFTAKANDKLTIKVKSGDTVFEKELTLPSAVEFKSGYVKKLNVTYTGGEQIQGSTLEEILAMDKDADVQTQEVLVVGKYARGIMLGQNGTFLLAFNNGGVDGAVGDIVTVSGKVGVYSDLKQITSPVVTVISSGNEVVLPDPKVLDNIDEYTSDKVEMIQYTGTLKVSGNYYNVEVAGCTNKGSIQYPLNTSAMTALNNKAVTATGFFTGISGSSIKYVNMMSTSVVEAAVNVFNVSRTEFDVSADVTSVTVNVSGNVDWTVVPGDNVTVDPTSGSGEGTVTITFPANTDTNNAKEYSVHITTEATGVEEDDFEIIITQAKAFDGVTISWDSYADWEGVSMGSSGSTVGSEEISLTDGDYLVTIKKNNGSTSPTVHGSNNDARAYAKATITVKNTKNVNMTQLVFNVSTQGLKRLAPITASTGTVATQASGDNTVTWTGEATEVTFTVGDKANYGSEGAEKAGQLCFDSINVVEGGQGVAKELSSIAVSGQKTNFNVGDTFVFGGTVTATYSDGSTSDVTSSATITPPDLSTAGSKTVDVSYTEDGVTKSTSYTITVSAVSGKTVIFVVGDDADIFSIFPAVKDGIKFEYTKGENGTEPAYYSPFRWYKNNSVTISGATIKQVTFSFESTYARTMTPDSGEYTLSGTEGTWSGEASSVTFTNGDAAARFSQVKVVYEGTGSETVGSYDPTLTFPKTELSLEKGKSLDNAASTNSPATVTYSSSNTSVATVDEAGKVTAVAQGTATITAAVAAVNGTCTKIKAATATCAVTVTAAAQGVVLELDLTTKSSSCNNYYSSTVYGDWTIVNGANNNGAWAYFKMGGKNTVIADNNPCYIYSNVASTAAAKKVTVHVPAGSLSKEGMSVNSWGLYVYSDAAMTQQVDFVEGGTITQDEGTFDFTPSSGSTWATGSYFKVSWDLANTSTYNGIVLVDRITVQK